MLAGCLAKIDQSGKKISITKLNDSNKARRQNDNWLIKSTQIGLNLLLLPAPQDTSVAC